MARPAHPRIPWFGAGRGPRVLGVNPWIFDFAAFNLWARPAGLLACLDMLRDAGADVALLDCLDPTWADTDWPEPGRYGAGHYPKTPLPTPEPLRFAGRRYARYGLDPDRVRTALTTLDPAPDAVLVTTVMTYWYPGALAILDLAAELWPSAVRVLGGTYATLCPTHARAHARANLILGGSLETPANWAACWSALGRDAPIPGSPLFAEAVKASPHPIADEPLFQNNSLWPCVPGGFDWSTAHRWKALLRGE